ncbi:MAG: response regulator [Bryobacterales bacterium]|nr:response regulator [Bryobacterales bacterium]
MHRILIADDSPEWRNIAAIALRTIPDAAVTTVESAEAALDLCHEQEFDILVTDVRMGEMNGLELLAALRKVERWPARGAIVMSGEPAATLAEAAALEGAAAFFQKPFSPGELRKQVLSLLDL